MINSGISTKIMIPAFIQVFLISISRFLIGPIIPVISSELNINPATFGWIISLNIFVLLIFTLIAGNLIDLLGLKAILYISMVIQALGFLIFFFVESPNLLIISNTILGIGSGMASVCLIVLANASQKGGTRGFFNLFLGAALALALAPVISIFIDRLEIDWRLIFMSLGIIQIVLIIIFGFFRFPEKVTHVPGIKGLIAANSLFFRSPLLIACFLFNVFNASVMETFYTWFTSYFSAYDVGIDTSSFVLFLFSAAVLIGVYAKKYLVRFTGERKMLFYNVSFSIIFLVLTLFIDNLILKSIFIFFFGLSLSANFILIISIALKDLREKYGAASGYLQAAEFVGIIIFQAVSGILSQYFMRSGIIYMNIILLIVIFIIVIFLNSRKLVRS
jgi:MFS family permease